MASVDEPGEGDPGGQLGVESLRLLGAVPDRRARHLADRANDISINVPRHTAQFPYAGRPAHSEHGRRHAVPEAPLAVMKFSSAARAEHGGGPSSRADTSRRRRCRAGAGRGLRLRRTAAAGSPADRAPAGTTRLFRARSAASPHCPPSALRCRSCRIPWGQGRHRRARRRRCAAAAARRAAVPARRVRHGPPMKSTFGLTKARATVCIHAGEKISSSSSRNASSVPRVAAMPAFSALDLPRIALQHVMHARAPLGHECLGYPARVVGRIVVDDIQIEGQSRDTGLPSSHCLRPAGAARCDSMSAERCRDASRSPQPEQSTYRPRLFPSVTRVVPTIHKFHARVGCSTANASVRIG